MTVGEVERHQCRRYRRGSPNQDTLRKTISNMANHIRNMAIIRTDSPVKFHPRSIVELNNLRSSMSHRQYVTLYNKFRPYEAFPPLVAGNHGQRTLSGFGVRTKQQNRGILKSRPVQTPPEEVVPLENTLGASSYHKMEVFVPSLSINKAKILSEGDDDASQYLERAKSSLTRKYQGEYIPGAISHRLSHLKNKQNYTPTYRITNAGTFVRDSESNRHVHEIRRPATSLSQRQPIEHNSVNKEYEIPKSQKPENRFKSVGQSGDGTKKVTFNENSEKQVPKIETYYMSEKGEKYLARKDELAPLTVRNLEIHQALLKPSGQQTEPFNENVGFISEVNRARIATWITDRTRHIPEVAKQEAGKAMEESRRRERNSLDPQGETHHMNHDEELQENIRNKSDDLNREKSVDIKDDDVNDNEEHVAEESPRYHQLNKNMLSISEFMCERVGETDDVSSLTTTDLEKELA